MTTEPRRPVLVTGASRGIGREIARLLAERGDQVAVHYGRDRAAAEETVGLLAGDGHVVLGADLASPAAARDLVDAAAHALGGLQVLVNNAAMFPSHPVLETTWEDWEQAWTQTLTVNLASPAAACWAAARHLRDAGGGAIVNVSSRGAFRGEPAAPAYGASKAGLNALGQSLAVALAPHGIGVHTVAPGFVETAMARGLLDGDAGDGIRSQSPFGRVARADEVARVVVFLADPGSVWTSGGVVDVNGASYLRT